MKPPLPPEDDTVSLHSPEVGGPEQPIARRIWMTRRLLRSAVRRYQQTLAFARAVDAAMPEPFRSQYDASPNPAAQSEGESRMWWRLLQDANSDFYSAEWALAERIFNLYDLLASEGKRVGPQVVGAGFVERGITLDGLTFILMDDPANFEAGTSIIAVAPIDRVIGLDD